MKSEAYLKAYFQTLADHGISQLSVTHILERIEDAFHKHDVENTLDSNGKKLFYELEKQV